MINLIKDLLDINDKEAKLFVSSLSFTQLHNLRESIDVMNFESVYNLYEAVTKPTKPTKPINATSQAIPQNSNGNRQQTLANKNQMNNLDIDDILAKIKNSSTVDMKNDQLVVKDSSGKEQIYSKEQVNQLASDPTSKKEIESKKPGIFSKFLQNQLDTFNPVQSFVNGYKSAKLESADDSLTEELATLKRLAGVNGKNENCAGTKAEMPSIIGNTSDSHKPTSKLRHELRKKLVAKERMKDNKYKKPT